ncbi:MAG: hypothetical protein WKG01_11245 [Kofleriaceae bacterium]
MLGDYILHFPLTDFAVSLLAIAALVDVARIVLKRAAWSTTVDILLLAGFLGALAAAASGLWLVSSQAHAHDELLSMHHWFAYGTLAAASASVLSRLLEKRSRVFTALKTGTLVAAALLVSGAGFYGGRMAHPPGAPSHHDDVPHEAMTPEQHGAMAPDAMTNAPSVDVSTMTDASTTTDGRKPARPSSDHDTKPHPH